MQKNYAQIILRDGDGKRLLEGIILEKAKRYDLILGKKISETQLNELIKQPQTAQSLEKIFQYLEAEEELKQLERELTSMAWQLNKSKNKFPNQTDWEKCYLHATQEVRIENVIYHFLGINNFIKNIKCPFHEDKNASLKVYIKNNHFICFGCYLRGSPIDFVIKYKNCPFKEAVFYLSNL